MGLLCVRQSLGDNSQLLQLFFLESKLREALIMFGAVLVSVYLYFSVRDFRDFCKGEMSALEVLVSTDGVLQIDL